MPAADRATSPASSPSSTVIGLGPHGERAATPDLITLSQDDRARARAKAPRLAIVLHTTASDWARRHIAGIEACLGEVGAAVVDIVDCAYDAAKQVSALERLAQSKLDAIISIPLGGVAVANAYRKVAAAGIKLILLDNAPPGLLPEADYVSVVSSDNFGLGQIAADLLSPHVPLHGSVCILAYKIDFFATAQREIAFRKWMQRERPDVRLSQVKFATPASVGAVIEPHLDGHADLDGLFVVWDEPAVESLRILKHRERRPAMTTVDLGRTVACALAEGEILKGVAAQRPFQQGSAAATAAIAALTGRTVPPWIVLPGIAVTPDNVAEAYQAVGGTPASPQLMAAGRE
jgi:ribose transport system substrate-binding protein